MACMLLIAEFLKNHTLKQDIRWITKLLLCQSLLSEYANAPIFGKEKQHMKRSQQMPSK